MVKCSFKQTTLAKLANMSNTPFSSLRQKRGRVAYQAGLKAEKAAARYLTHLGWNILYTRYKTAAGEIDLIASYENILVFYEVKQRLSHSKAAYAFSSRQMKRVRQAAEIVLAEHPTWQYEFIRIDVFLFDIQRKHQILKNAVWDEE